MKYGIDQQLDPATADLAKRFHTVMLQRLYELQCGAQREVGNWVDGAIAMMEMWHPASEPTCRCGIPQEQCHPECPHRADGVMVRYVCPTCGMGGAHPADMPAPACHECPEHPVMQRAAGVGGTSK